MILYSSWLKLPLDVRHKIAHQFGIAKSKPTHVSDNRVVEDGFRVEDVEASLNLEAMRTFVGIDHTDMNTLFDLVVAKIKGEEVIAAPQAVNESVSAEPAVSTEDVLPELETPKKKVSKAKKPTAKKKIKA